MAEPQTRENLAQNPSLSPLSRASFAAADPDPADHLPVSPAAVAVAVADDARNEDPDLTREPKRRKHCPVELENLDELTSASNSSFAFTFDTKFCGFAAEVTPKFGSFNSMAPEIEKKEQSEVRVRGDEDRKGETVQREEEDDEEREIGDALREAIGGGLESVAD